MSTPLGLLVPPRPARWIVLSSGVSLAALTAFGQPSPAPAPLASDTPTEIAPTSPARVASYDLRARLEPSSHSVFGEGTIRWVNGSHLSIDELYFHLYLNAFKHTESLFNRSPFTRARSGRAPQSWGQISVLRLSARELPGVDLLAAMEAHSPGDPLDETDRRVALPSPVAPGAGLTLEIAWQAILPEIVERTGFSRDFYFVAQWFPKLARLEATGEWAHFAFHPHAEFYADFGDYDVTLDVPSDMIVGATGRRTSETRVGERRIIVQRAQAVHDFAWTAWPRFQERHERILETDVHLLYPRGHDRNAERTLETLRFALPFFGARYGQYPYADLTVVHPPSHAAAAGGMEYPTLITTGGPWHSGYWGRGVETVTLHELGHQWFYGLLATNEARWPFLDEGLNSYAESVAAEAMFGAASASKLLGFEFSSAAVHRALMQLEPQTAALALPASGFVSFAELGAVVYSRTALLLRSLGQVYGQVALDQGLQRYAQRYRFGHPEPEDLVALVSEALGAPAAQNLRGALFQGHGVNYLVRDLRVAPLTEPRGILTPGAPQRSANDPALFESRVSVHREGELRLPVEVLLLTADGERISKHWDGETRVEMISHVGASPVVAAVVDPSQHILVDSSLLDNAVRQTPVPALNTFDRAVYVFQLLLSWLAP
jgi:peptidase M1-like protein